MTGLFLHAEVIQFTEAFIFDMTSLVHWTVCVCVCVGRGRVIVSDVH